MKIVICGSYGVGNIGDEAILAGIKKLLSKVAPGGEITVLGQGSLLPIGIRSFFRILLRPGLLIRPLRIIRDCDIFILGGGGLFTDEERTFVGGFWALHGLAAHWFGKKLFILGVSVGPMGFLSTILVKRLFQKARLITTRDPKSSKLIDKLGSKSLVLTDLAVLAIDAARRELASSEHSERAPIKVTNDGNYAVISLRKYKNTDEKLYTIIAQLCDYLISKKALNIIFIPFQKGANNDAHILNKVFDRLANKKPAKILDYDDDLDHISQILGDAEVVIAMRLHAGIIANALRTPVISLNYMSKNANYWDQFKNVQQLPIQSVSLSDMILSVNRVLEEQRVPGSNQLKFDEYAKLLTKYI